MLVEELRLGHWAIQDPKHEVSPRHRDPLGWVERGVVVVRQSVCLDVFLARPPPDVQLHLLNPKLVRELDQHQTQRILGGCELVQSKPVGAVVSGSRQGHRTPRSATASTPRGSQQTTAPGRTIERHGPAPNLQFTAADHNLLPKLSSKGRGRCASSRRTPPPTTQAQEQPEEEDQPSAGRLLLERAEERADEPQGASGEGQPA